MGGRGRGRFCWCATALAKAGKLPIVGIEYGIPKSEPSVEGFIAFNRYPINAVVFGRADPVSYNQWAQNFCAEAACSAR